MVLLAAAGGAAAGEGEAFADFLLHVADDLGLPERQLLAGSAGGFCIGGVLALQHAAPRHSGITATLRAAGPVAARTRLLSLSAAARAARRLFSVRPGTILADGRLDGHAGVRQNAAASRFRCRTPAQCTFRKRAPRTTRDDSRPRAPRRRNKLMPRACTPPENSLRR